RDPIRMTELLRGPSDTLPCGSSRERKHRSAVRPATSGARLPPSATQFWKQPEYFTSLLILFFVNMADRTFGPIIPLFLEELGTPAARLAVVSGGVISAAALGEAFSAWVSGQLATRVSLRRLITGRLVFSILVLVPMIFVTSAEQ